MSLGGGIPDRETDQVMAMEIRQENRSGDGNKNQTGKLIR
jgi:hypothetical protein